MPPQTRTQFNDNLAQVIASPLAQFCGSDRGVRSEKHLGKQMDLYPPLGRVEPNGPGGPGADFLIIRKEWVSLGSSASWPENQWPEFNPPPQRY